VPRGVHYGALLEEWRDHLWNGRRRPWKVRPLMWAVGSSRRVRAIGIARRHAGRRREAPGRRTSCSGASSGSCIRASAATHASWPPNLAAPAHQGCCGALHAHNGALERGNELAKELGEELPGTIVTTAGDARRTSRACSAASA
jgi:glycolate oxidase iron-sulfur subunit